MPKVTSSAVLPRLHITQDDSSRLSAIRTALEEEVLDQYEDFVHCRKRQIDSTRWKQTRKEENDLRVYQERARKLSDEVFMTTPARESTALLPQAAMADECGVARVLVTGTIPGRVEDAMFGTSFTDTTSLRTMAAYQKEFLEDNAVLCSIEVPSQDEPYRYMGITWHLRTFPLPTLVMKSRDCMLLQSVRQRVLSTGEKVGVCVRHTIEHRDLPELNAFSTIRIAMSAVTVYRQADLHRLEVFAIELLDPKGHTGDSFQVQEATKDLLTSVTTVCHTGFKKKLHTLMSMRHHERKTGERSPFETATKNERHCAMCEKSTSGLFSASGSSCQLCFKHVCSRCSMTHDIVIDASTSRVVTKPFDFCIECLLHAKKVPAESLALEQVEARRTSHKMTRSP